VHSLLVVDDDADLCSLLQDYLGRAGFTVAAVHDGRSGLETLRSGTFDLVILDVMLPGISGLETLRLLRTESNIPVLMLTARDEDVDRIVGLELGADDYLPKPFNPRELAARIKAVLRRSSGVPAETDDDERVRVGLVILDLATRTVRRDEAPVDLTTTEFALLEVLLRSAGRVVKREELSSKALHRNLTRFDRSIDVHISKLRKKLVTAGESKDVIRTIRGMGYQYARPTA